MNRKVRGIELAGEAAKLATQEMIGVMGEIILDACGNNLTKSFITSCSQSAGLLEVALNQSERIEKLESENKRLRDLLEKM